MRKAQFLQVVGLGLAERFQLKTQIIMNYRWSLTEVPLRLEFGIPIFQTSLLSTELPKFILMMEL